MKKLLFLWGELKSTFWFIPTLIICLSVAAAIGFIALDNHIRYVPEGLFSNVFAASTESARSILSTIATAMIGVAGTVFSITLVALTLASSQYGPRLLRNFMLERINQIVLGTYISTYVYCLIVLNAVKESDKVSFIPTISVFVSILAAVANIVLLIIFIHHIALSIQADKIISDISESLSKSIKKLFPEKIESDAAQVEPPITAEITSQFQYTITLHSPRNGYIQYIDYDRILSKAIEHHFLIELYFRPGDYLVENQKIGNIYSNEKITQESIKVNPSHFLDSDFIIGNARTPQQDIEFSVHQMVEVADRALSPGINDPYTAIACIDNLTSIICQLSLVKFHSPHSYDEDGVLRMIANRLDFNGILNSAFNHIRQYSNNNAPVAIRLIEALVTIHDYTDEQKYKQAIIKHAEMVVHQAENHFTEKQDFYDLKACSKSLFPGN